MHKILQHYRAIGLGLIGIFFALSPLKAQEFSMVTIENIRQIPPRYEVVDYATWIQINGSELVYRFKGKTKILQLDVISNQMGTTLPTEKGTIKSKINRLKAHGCFQ
ncbi:hypothetical protein [Persicobacter sp. CCB-QB2]|uniref:hypothetical protein n=1 Tax=Persicobacter sp. CCB-QB2 TaxID=1561025 RepID=UPI0006A9E7E4|nr:hypothetical protein [Persicobacter sp. CCB-QB2]